MRKGQPVADSHTLEVLDYPTILRMLSERASTPLGREEALSIEPLTDLEDIERLLDETSEAREFLAGRGHPPFTGVEDIRPVLERASLEGTLEPEELLSVASTVEAAEEVKRALLKASREFPLLAEHAKRMP
ncbi:MAG TPA: endonuclease MutS2, partial [Armatimonadetes bacterium]|nr:endonuclease MutS2 [Armatimonadota bacterium]